MRQIFQFIHLIIDRAEVKHDSETAIFPFFLIQGKDVADVPVHDTFFAAIDQLDDLVVDPKNPVLVFDFLSVTGIEFFLKLTIDGVDSDFAFVKGN